MPTSGEYTLGLTFILLCAVIWAGASVMIQYIYEDLDFRSPFLLTYLATSLLSAHLLGNALHNKYTAYRRSRRSEADDSSDLLPRAQHAYSPVDAATAAGKEEDMGAASALPAEQQPSGQQQQHMQMVRIGCCIAPAWFAANCLYNYSLLMTSVSSSTIISNLSASFTLFFSWYMGLEEVSTGKILGVIVCFGGAVAVGLQDEDDQQQTLLGDIVALLASACYGVYTTMIRYTVPDDHTVSMQLVLGYVGAANALLFLPAIIIMVLGHWGNMNDLTGKTFGFIALNGFGDTVIADYFWARAIVLTSPTVATIGMSITIPIALLTDFIFHGMVPTYISVLGSCSVILGFVLVNLDSEQQAQIVAYVKEKWNKGWMSVEDDDGL